MMIERGGAATHYGVLYQALSTIDAAFAVSSRGDDPDDPETITLTVEPRGGGGDTITQDARCRRVMQFKARGDRRTWSLNEIIDDVLRDLYRAVADEPDSHSVYLLITEGRRGQIGDASAFFRELTRDLIPDEPLAILDDVEQHQYFPAGEPITRRKFFDRIARRVSRTPDDGFPSPAAYRRVWSLLSRFRIREKKFEDVERRVKERLLGYVDAPEDVHGKARELFGILLQLAARGPQTFTLPGLLGRADLPTMSLANLPYVRNVAADRLAARLKHLGHEESTVVRRTASLADGDAVFCIVGDSGSGKSTLAAQIATDCAAKEIVVFVSTRAGVEGALQQAADEVWKRVLGHGRVLDWDSLIDLSRRVGLANRGRWLTVCLDITAGFGEVRQLLRLEWSAWNVRLLFTADEAAGKKIREEPKLASRCPVQILGELSVAETYELLKKRGRSMAQVPEDVVSLLRRPILADVYCRVTRDATWKPTNEYELFDAFWRGVQEGRDGEREHPLDLGILGRLSETILEGKEPYPWPQDVLHSMSVSEDALRRLIQHGWLHQLETTDVEFAHERFANWALAHAIFERRKRGQWTTGELSVRLTEIYNAKRTPGKLFLGYVPMDALWLLAHHGVSTESIVATIRSLDGTCDQNGSLYEKLLPSLGSSIVPALHNVMREEGPGARSLQAISRCIREIATRETIPVRVVAALLNDDIEEIHDTGLSVAQIRPQPGSINRLWRLTQEAGAGKKNTQSHWRHERTLHALVRAVRENPDWIRTETRATDSLEELRTLAWLISTIGDERGAALWRELKSLFLQHFGSEGARGALQCIDRYNDIEEVERLVRWFSTGVNFVPSEALSALAAIDADRAFAIVENDPLDRVQGLAAFWLPSLLLHDTMRTRAAIRKRFEESAFSSASLRWDFRGEHQPDGPMIRVVIQRLERLITEHLRASGPDRPPVEIEHLLGVLGSVNSVDGLRTLRGEAESTFAKDLVQLVARYTPHDSNTFNRPFVRHVQQVLLRIGGEVLSAFVRRQLRNPGPWPRSSIRSAVTSPSPEALALLVGLAKEPPKNEQEGTPAMDALHTIAALGERQTVLDLLERHAHLWVDHEVLKLLEGCHPIEDEQLLQLMNRDTSSVDDRIRRFHLLSLSARSDVIEQLIEEVLEEPDYNVKTDALYAIRRLANSTTSIDAVLRIGFSHEAEDVAEILCAIGTDEAFDVLERQLAACDGAQISSSLAAITSWLVTTRHKHALAPVVWQFLQSPGRLYAKSTTRLYHAAGYYSAPEVLDFLHAEAFRGDDRIGAIRGLSHQQPEAAFEAASAALASSQAGRSAFADVIVDIDAVRAVDALSQQLIRERVALVRAYICRALRRMQNDEHARQRVSTMIASSDPYERAAGCQAAGWFDHFEDTKLRALALREPDSMVRDFALGAVQMHMHNERVAALLAELVDATGSYAWALLEAVLDSASALLLEYPNDPLWLGHAMANKSRAMAIYARQRLQERLKDDSGQRDNVFEPYYR